MALPAAPNNPSTDDNPYAPRPSDAAWSTGPVFLEETGVSAEPAGSSQYQLFLSGSLPTPCHELRVKIEPPDAQLRIQVEVYSVVDPNMMCTQVLKAFEAAIPLNVSDSGNYTVWVNGDQAGSLTIP